MVQATYVKVGMAAVGTEGKRGLPFEKATAHLKSLPVKKDTKVSLTQHLRADGRGPTETSITGRAARGNSMIVTRDSCLGVARGMGLLGAGMFLFGFMCEFVTLSVGGDAEYNYGCVYRTIEFASGLVMLSVTGLLFMSQRYE